MSQINSLNDRLTLEMSRNVISANHHPQNRMKSPVREHTCVKPSSKSKMPIQNLSGVIQQLSPTQYESAFDSLVRRYRSTKDNLESLNNLNDDADTPTKITNNSISCSRISNHLHRLPSDTNEALQNSLLFEGINGRDNQPSTSKLVF